MNLAMCVGLLFAGALSSSAQFTAKLNRLPGGSTEVRIRNDAAIVLQAYALRIQYISQASSTGASLFIYIDPLVDVFPKIRSYPPGVVVGPLQPGQEFAFSPDSMLRVIRIGEKPVFEQAISTAAIFADGSTAGDAALLERLLSRRSNMLLAVEMTLETLADAGKHHVPREKLIDQFQRLVDSGRRWYLPPEQQIGQGLYQAFIGRLINLPKNPIGTAFPPGDFVAQETARLNQQRVALLQSQPSLADAALIGK